MEVILILIVDAALGIIPGKIAERKGHSFWLWWFYGWMLFIFAIIHVQFIEDYTKAETESKNLVLESKASAPDQLLKYKQLLDAGAITEKEFQEKKRQLLNL
ncbi:MAG: SHOCT domain-containing protein [Oscillospiraceae bacterium]|nr:SHOCT domain-containing protein [Oscillospiraceae bacterium]